MPMVVQAAGLGVVVVVGTGWLLHWRWRFKRSCSCGWWEPWMQQWRIIFCKSFHWDLGSVQLLCWKVQKYKDVKEVRSSQDVIATFIRSSLRYNAPSTLFRWYTGSNLSFLATWCFLDSVVALVFATLVTSALGRVYPWWYWLLPLSYLSKLNLRAQWRKVKSGSTVEKSCRRTRRAFLSCLAMRFAPQILLFYPLIFPSKTRWSAKCTSRPIGSQCSWGFDQWEDRRTSHVMEWRITRGCSSWGALLKGHREGQMLTDGWIVKHIAAAKSTTRNVT